MFKDVCSFAKNQNKATYGLGYKLTLIRISDNSVLNIANATTDTKLKFNGFEWYVPR